MNNDRRKTIGNLIAELDGIKESIEFETEAEQEYADNMPDNMQESEKHERAEEITLELDQVASEIGDIIDRLQEITE